MSYFWLKIFFVAAATTLTNAAACTFVNPEVYTTQAILNNLSECTTINGTLVIDFHGIDLSPLANLEKINGALVIANTPVRDIISLPSLVSIEDWEDQQSLLEIRGPAINLHTVELTFPKLRTVKSIKLEGLATLSSISFPKLQTVSLVSINNCDSLTELPALPLASPPPKFELGVNHALCGESELGSRAEVACTLNEAKLCLIQGHPDCAFHDKCVESMQIRDLACTKVIGHLVFTGAGVVDIGTVQVITGSLTLKSQEIVEFRASGLRFVDAIGTDNDAHIQLDLEWEASNEQLQIFGFPNLLEIQGDIRVPDNYLALEILEFASLRRLNSIDIDSYTVFLLLFLSLESAVSISLKHLPIEEEGLVLSSLVTLESLSIQHCDALTTWDFVLQFSQGLLVGHNASHTLILQ